MRLICPNCSAQYEVDGSLIPDEGRDVQCSNCGHNWFELPPATEAAAPPPDLEVEDDSFVGEAEEVADPADTSTGHEQIDARDDGVDAAPEPEPELDATPEADDPTPEVASADETEDDDWDWPRPDEARQPPPAEPTPPRERSRRPGELAALEILKEEADRELAKRKDFPEPIETQPELMPQDDPRDRETPSRALRARMARLRGEDEDEDEANAEAAEEDDAYRAPRKDLLPDIDEINSSLRPAGLARGERSEAEEAEHRRGFRVGFVGIVGLVVLMIVAYAQAPAIAGVLPGTEGALLDYVDWANRVRDLFGS